MRILHVSMLYPPHVLGGAERSVAMLAEAQAAAGYEIFAACTTPGVFAEEVRNGVHVFRMPHGTRFWAEDWPQHSAPERLWRKASMPFNRVLRRHFETVLDRVRPDIVHTHSMVDVSTNLWRATAARGYTLVHTLRDYDLMCTDGSMYHGGKGCGPKCRVLSVPKQCHHRHITAVVGISAEVLRQHTCKGLFDTLDKDLCRVIWNSARVKTESPDNTRADRTSEPFTFGFLGRVTAEKGIGVLTEAMRLLLRKQDARLLVAGTSPTGLEPFENDAKGLPIRFAGHMEPLDFFEQVDVLVVPSVWAEPFGRIVIEAYSMGVPVLASEIGGIPDIIAGDHADWLVPPGDAATLASRMGAIVAAGREALPSAANFESVIARTSPDAVMAEYHSLYLAALLERKRVVK